MMRRISMFSPYLNVPNGSGFGGGGRTHHRPLTGPPSSKATLAPPQTQTCAIYASGSSAVSFNACRYLKQPLEAIQLDTSIARTPRACGEGDRHSLPPEALSGLSTHRGDDTWEHCPRETTLSR